MSKTIRLMRSAALCAACAGTLALSLPAQASDAGWFLGGVLATKLAGAIKQSVEADKQQANAAQQQAHAAQQQAHAMRMAPPPPRAPLPKTPQQKLNELDALAAGGYITPAEYKARRKAILDSL
jgi:hypothetical protein